MSAGLPKRSGLAQSRKSLKGATISSGRGTQYGPAPLLPEFFWCRMDSVKPPSLPPSEMWFPGHLLMRHSSSEQPPEQRHCQIKQPHINILDFVSVSIFSSSHFQFQTWLSVPSGFQTSSVSFRVWLMITYVSAAVRPLNVINPQPPTAHLHVRAWRSW